MSDGFWISLQPLWGTCWVLGHPHSDVQMESPVFQVLFFKAAFYISTSILVHGVIPPWVQDFALNPWTSWGSCLLNSSGVEVSLAAQPCGISATPPGFVSSANSLRVCSAPSGSLMRMLNRIGAGIVPWSTLIVTGFQLDFVPLTEYRLQKWTLLLIILRTYYSVI